jgi:DMSO/TMAO reductase YedYZ heme-binding membrane subunit
MKINQQYNGTIIGGIFTLVSLLLTLTFIIPILSVLPGVFIESMMPSLVDNEPYSNIGKATIMTLVIIMIISIAIILIKARKTKISNGQMFGVMAFEYFIIHSLGFYIYWATSLNFRSDGQLIFGAVNSFPASSFGFIGIGIIIDLIKTKQLEKENTKK